MRSILIVAFAALLAISVSLRPTQVSIPAAATIEPFMTAAAGSGHVVRAVDKREVADKAARSAILRSALNLGAWGCMAGYAVARLGRRMPVSPIWHE